MEMVLVAGYELAATLIPVMVAFVLVRASAQRTGRAVAGLAPVLLFTLYVFAVFYVTGVGTVFDLARHGFEANPHQLNLVPLAALTQSGVIGDVLTGFVLNVVLFVPLGFLLPLVWPRAGRILPVATFGLGLSLVIELSQLLNNRTTDVDDLVANTLGTLVGFALWALWRDAVGRVAIVRRKRAGAHAPKDGSLHAAAMPQVKEAPVHAPVLPRPWRALAEPVLYVAALFAGHFFLFNEIGLVGLLYGF